MYFTLTPLSKTFTYSAPHNNYLHPHPKILFALSRITNKWLGEEGTISCRPFYFIFKNVLFSYILQNRLLKKLFNQKDVIFS